MSKTSGLDDLPNDVREIIAGFPPDGQTKLLELYTKYHFDDAAVECFTINAGKLVTANLKEFQMFLENDAAETASKALKLTAPKRPRVSDPGRKRPLPPVVTPNKTLPPGVSAAFSGSKTLPPGVSAAFGGAGIQTAVPDPKRLRAENADVVGNAVNTTALGIGAAKTPEPVKVSLKSSLNDKLVVPPIGTQSNPVALELLGESSLWLDAKGGAYTWMDESIEDRAAAHDMRLASFEGPMLEVMHQIHADEDITVGTIGVPTQQEVMLCGRIACEGLEGKLNERSLLLEGTKASSNGARVQLNVAECPRIAAFPGQIVSVLGRSGSSGATFHAKEFLTGLPHTVRSTTGVLADLTSHQEAAPIHAVVAAGPFCTRDSLDYSPLEKLLEYAAQVRPQVLIIVGPFLAADNVKVASGDTTFPGEEAPCSFEDFYAELVLPTLRNGVEELKRQSPFTEVCILSSTEDVMCLHPFPQPPLDISLATSRGDPHLEHLRRLGVRFLPNPSHLLLAGLRVSICSADALKPIMSEIVLRPAEKGAKRLEEAYRLLLQQRTLFPVLPTDPAQVAETRAMALDFPDGALPDVCIFPSQLFGGASATFVDNSVFVNPGLLCRAAVDTFAELWITPPSKDAHDSPLRERTRVDIQKLG